MFIVKGVGIGIIQKRKEKFLTGKRNH